MNEQSPATVYLSKWPQRGDTFKTMRQALERVVEVTVEKGGEVSIERFPWHELRYETTRGIAAKLIDSGASVPSVNKSLVALRGVLESAWRSGLIPNEDYQRIKIKNMRGSSPKAGRALTTEETDAILAALPGSRPQEAALIAILCATGVRRVELVRLRAEDFDQKTNRLLARGKGDKPRYIPIAPRWLPFILAWWGGLAPKALAFTEYAGKKAMSRRTVSYIVETFCADTGLPRFTCHDLRRTFATRVCESADISIASKLLGHFSTDTTRLYDRRGEGAEADAVKDI
jgi:integrase/recombinase XerC